MLAFSKERFFAEFIPAPAGHGMTAPGAFFCSLLEWIQKLNPAILCASSDRSPCYPLSAIGKNTRPSINLRAVRPTTTSSRRKVSFSPLVVIPTDMIPEG